MNCLLVGPGVASGFPTLYSYTPFEKFGSIAADLSAGWLLTVWLSRPSFHGEIQGNSLLGLFFLVVYIVFALLTLSRGFVSIFPLLSPKCCVGPLGASDLVSASVTAVPDEELRHIHSHSFRVSGSTNFLIMVLPFIFVGFDFVFCSPCKPKS